MTARVSFRTRPGVDLSDALVLLGMPTVGFVGAITAQHLVRALGMREAGDVRSPAFPPFYLVHGGRLRSPMRLFALDAACADGLSCARLVVVSSEFAPPPSLARPLAQAMLAWAKEMRAGLVVVPDGIPADGEGVPDVYGVATSEAGVDLLRTMRVDPLEEGAMGGFSGVVLDAAEDAGVEALCLLGETNPRLPDARAAARVVSALRWVLPDVPLDADALLEEAERIEAEVRELAGMARRQTQGAPPDEPALPMFR